MFYICRRVTNVSAEADAEHGAEASCGGGNVVGAGYATGIGTSAGTYRRAQKRAVLIRYTFLKVHHLCSDTAKHVGDVVRRLWNATSTDEAKRTDMEFYLIQRLMRYAVHTDCRTAHVMEQARSYLGERQRQNYSSLRRSSQHFTSRKLWRRLKRCSADALRRFYSERLVSGTEILCVLILSQNI